MLAQQLFNGLILGLVYALGAIAYSLVMGVFGVLNLAIAGIFVVGGYVGLDLVMSGQPLWLAIAAATAVSGILGYLADRVAYSPLRKAPSVMPLLSTLGVAIVLVTVVVNVWGSDPLQLDASPLSGSFTLGPVTVTGTQVLIAVGTIILFIALHLFVQRTWTGRTIRAVADNSEVAPLMGINSTWTVGVTFAVSGVLAGVSGLMIGLNYGQLTPYVGLDVGLNGVAVMVIGGARNIWGGLLAGPLVGILEVLTVAYLESSWRSAVVWGAVSLVLLVRPQGLFTLRPETERV